MPVLSHLDNCLVLMYLNDGLSSLCAGHSNAGEPNTGDSAPQQSVLYSHCNRLGHGVPSLFKFVQKLQRGGK
jgi:hypothetical protein